MTQLRYALFGIAALIVSLLMGYTIAWGIPVLVFSMLFLAFIGWISPNLWAVLFGAIILNILPILIIYGFTDYSGTLMGISVVYVIPFALFIHFLIGAQFHFMFQKKRRDAK